MITSTMTNEEIIKQIRNDNLALCDKTMKFFKKNLRRAYLKSNVFPRYHLFRTKINGTDYLLMMSCPTRRKASNNAFLCITMVSVESDEGKMIMELEMRFGTDRLIIYTPHFWRRYRERMAFTDLSHDELIYQFKKRNFTKGLEVDKIRNGQHEGEMAINDGALMVQYSGRDILVKTFIGRDTFGTMKAERYGVSAKTLSSLKEAVKEARPVICFV